MSAPETSKPFPVPSVRGRTTETHISGYDSLLANMVDTTLHTVQSDVILLEDMLEKSVVRHTQDWNRIEALLAKVVALRDKHNAAKGDIRALEKSKESVEHGIKTLSAEMRDTEKIVLKPVAGKLDLLERKVKDVNDDIRSMKSVLKGVTQQLTERGVSATPVARTSSS